MSFCYVSNYFIYGFKSQHIEAWFTYMWNLRADDADWVMVGPFFSTQLLQQEVPYYYAEGVTYGVPWSAENVEKVRCPIHVLDDSCLCNDK